MRSPLQGLHDALERLVLAYHGYPLPVSRTAQAWPRIAAVGDVHALCGSEERLSACFRSLEDIDLVLVAGDLTSTGRADEARALAMACRHAPAPVACVLGNHDWHAGEQDGIATALEEAGVRVLDREHEVYDVRGRSVAVVGTTGFIGGFLEDRLPDFGEPLLRDVYAKTSEEVEAIERGLVATDGCDHRIVLLHYSPTVETLVGEREGLWLLLGSDRLAAPIARHSPDLVVHGHAHAGRAEGAIGAVPVYNVSQPVIRDDFRTFELDGDRRLSAAPRAE
jgi:Icc-related predicted phosphoesterase